MSSSFDGQRGKEDGKQASTAAKSGDAASIPEENDGPPGARPFWDVLGTWEQAELEDHELRYLELKRIFGNDPAVRAELQTAIATARRRFGSTSGD